MLYMQLRLFLSAIYILFGEVTAVTKSKLKSRDIYLFKILFIRELKWGYVWTTYLSTLGLTVIAYAFMFVNTGY